jgi:hypothetical protein
MPPPPPPTFSGAPAGATPGGYVAYQQGGVQRSVRGLGTAVLVMYAAVTVLAVLLAGALYRRATVFEEVIDLGQRATPADGQRLLDTDNLVVTTSWMVIAGVVLGAVATAMWAFRLAKNAQARGSYVVNPGMAAGGWFIPIGFWWVGFNEVQRSVEFTGQEAKPVKRWQVAWVAGSLLGFFVRNGLNDFDTSGPDAFVSSLQRQWVLGLVSALLYAVGLAFAWKAVRTASAALQPA